MSTAQRPTATRLRDVRAELAQLWPEIGGWLRVERGEVSFDYLHWTFSVEHRGVHGEDLATAYQQQIAYYEWLLERRLTGHLAGDRHGQYLCAKWTDSMTYCCRRLAAMARGDDPGEWIDQHVRRPDLAAKGGAIAAQRDADAGHDEHLPADAVDTDATWDLVLARVS